MRRAANAHAVEPDEVFVSSNELLEANVVSIRADLTDLKGEFRAVIARIDHDIRAMAARAESEIKAAVARMDEQFREVRQDIRELREDNKTIRDKIDANYGALDQKIDTGLTHLNQKIDANYAALDQKIDAGLTRLDKKIDTKVDELRADMKDLRVEMKDLRADMKDFRTDLGQMAAGIADLKGMQKAILWILGGVATLVSIAGVIFPIVKALWPT